MKSTGFATRQREPLRRRTRLRPKRRKPGVTGRPSLDSQEWNLLKQALWKRAGGRCEVPWCRTAREPLDPDHVIPRSHGGADDLGNLALLCRRHHQQKSAAYAAGRLVIEMPEWGRPRFVVVTAPDKFTVRSVSASSTGRNGAGISVAARSRRRPDQHPVVIPRREALYPTVPQRRGR